MPVNCLKVATWSRKFVHFAPSSNYSGSSQSLHSISARPLSALPAGAAATIQVDYKGCAPIQEPLA